MTLQLKVAEEQSAKGDYHRTVRFRSGSGSWKTLLPTWPHGWDLPPKPPKEWNPVAEVYVKVTLDQLREIDDDAELQTKFINRKLKPADGTVGLPIVRLCLKKGQQVKDKDIQYLCCLFPPPPYLTAGVPFLFYYEYKLDDKGHIVLDEKGKPVPELREAALDPMNPQDYMDFAERFISQAGPSYSRELALGLPLNFTAMEVPRLLKAYRDYGAPLAIVDAFGGPTYDRYPEMRALKGIGSKGKTYSLRELFGEDHAFYALDSKPYVGVKGDVAATHLLQLVGGYSSFGPRHTNTTMVKKPEDGDRPPPPKPPRVLVPNEIAYCRAGKSTLVTDPISKWAAKVAPEIKRPWLDYTLRSRFTAEAIVAVALNMAGWAAENKLSDRLDRRRIIRNELGRVRKLNRKLLDPTPSGKQTTL